METHLLTPEPSAPTAPARNRLRVQLEAPPARVWSLLGDLSRYPEYSAGLSRVDPTVDARGLCTEYLCHFRPMEGTEPLLHREIMLWYAPGRGYASRAEEPNAFGLTEAVTLVRLEPSEGGTLLTWTQHYESENLPEARAVFDAALADIGANLVRIFGGREWKRHVEG